MFKVKREEKVQKELLKIKNKNIKIFNILNKK